MNTNQPAPFAQTEVTVEMLRAYEVRARQLRAAFVADAVSKLGAALRNWLARPVTAGKARA